jgi:tight adherence protein B
VPRRSITASTVVARAPIPRWLEQALALTDASIPPARAWSGLRAAAVAAVAGVGLVASPLAAAAMAAGLLAAPRGVGRVAERAWWRRRDAQLPAALDLLAADLRAGSALGPAVVALGSRTPDPLGAELRAVGATVRHGGGLADALDDWSRSPRSSPEVRLAAAALGLGAAAGGPVARSVDQVAATLRERREVRAEATALATQARASAAVLAVAPLGFTVLVAGVEPTAVRFLTSSAVGLACLVAGLALEVTGAAWMARILRSAS